MHSQQPTHRVQVAEIADTFRALLKRPERRRRGTHADRTLLNLEKAIGRDHIKTAEHLAKLFTGWIDEGVDVEDATRFFREGEALVRAYASLRPMPPDEAALAARTARECGDVFAAIPSYFERRGESERRMLAKEVGEAVSALEEFQEVLHRDSLDHAKAS
jgi:hypothetical protein